MRPGAWVAYMGVWKSIFGSKMAKDGKKIERFAYYE